MKCPVCPDATLLMSDRQGVEIDYCPACRGIWLDRGELDKLLELAVIAATPSAPASTSTGRHAHQPNFEDSDFRGGKRHFHERKKSWLHDFFD